MAMSGGTAKLVKTGTLNYGNAAATVKLYVYYKTSQNIANNKSTITCGMYITVTSGWTIGSWTDFNGSYVGTTGLTFTKGIPAGTGGTYWLAENKSFTVSHNSDGKKTATIYWKWGVNSPWGQMVTPSGSFTIDLPQIPRSSSLSLSATSVNVGGSITASISRASSSFTHHVKFFIKGYENKYYKEYEDVGTSQTFSIPTDWYKAMPSSTSCTAYCRIATYNGGTPIGSTVTKSFTVKVPSGIKPTISTSLKPTNVTINNVSTAVNYLVKGKNNITVSVSNCAAGTGSSIKSYSFSGPSISYTGTKTSVSGGPVTQYGTLTYTVTVTDTRGRTASASQAITCHNYYSPSFTSFNISRDGTTLKCTYKVAYATVSGKNSATVKIYVDGSLKKTISGVANGTSGSATIALADSDATYEVYAVVSDYFNGSGKTETASILGASRVFNAAADGNGFAVGKMSEQAGFECGWDAKLYSDCEIDGSLKVGTSTRSTPPTTGIFVHDVRDATVYPNSLGDKNVNFYFDNLSGWKGVMHMKGWTGDNYAAWELAGNAHNDITTDPDLYYRQGVGSTWDEWQKIITNKNIGKYVDLSKYLPTAGGTLGGKLTLGSNMYYASNNTAGLDCNNSDIINANGIYFKDTSNSAGESINFPRGDGTWDTLYAKDGVLKFQTGRALDGDLGGSKIFHSGMIHIETGTITLNCVGATTKSFANTFNSVPNVLLTPITTTDGVISGKVREVTTTGFTAIIGGSGFTSIPFRYIAIYGKAY